MNIIRISKHCEMEWMLGRSRARQEKPTQLSVADGAAAGGGKGIILKSQPNTPQNTLHHARAVELGISIWDGTGFSGTGLASYF